MTLNSFASRFLIVLSNAMSVSFTLRMHCTHFYSFHFLSLSPFAFALFRSLGSQRPDKALHFTHTHFWAQCACVCEKIIISREVFLLFRI